MSRLAVVAAFIRRDWQTDLSYRAAFGLELAGLVLSLAIFFYLGRVIDNQEFSADQGLDGGYFGFVAIGLGLFQIIRASLSSFSRKLRDEQTTGTFEALLATPASPSLIILASAAYDLIRATVTGVILIGVAVVVFGLSLEPSVPDLGLALLALAGCIGLFVSLGVAVAAFTVVFKRAIGLLGIVLGGLALLGGVYFPISVFPDVIEAVAEALPFTWGLDTVRSGLLGGSVEAEKLIGLWASVAVLVPLALLLFGASVRRARRAGTLAQY